MKKENKDIISLSPEAVVKNLDKAIDYVASSVQCYCTNPASDFTRNRRIPLKSLIHFLLQKKNKSSLSELNDYFPDPSSLPTVSALTQQRNKLDSDAFKKIFDVFNLSCEHLNTFKDYIILAQDGSDINIPYDPSDKETLCVNSGHKPYSQYHLNALYDCLNHIFYDVTIDAMHKKNEYAALMNIVKDGQYPEKSVILMDRGYESYNLFACCIENKQKFVVRIKDVSSSTGILKNVPLPDGSFDVWIHKSLTRRQTSSVKNDKRYTFVPSTSNFDYFDDDGFYEMDLRIVRFKITDDTYECLCTNLSEEEFSAEDMKELYYLRWNEETAFSHLKYTADIIHFTSRKRNSVKQEIYAALIMYNVSQMIVNNIRIKQKKKYKHKMKANFKEAYSNILRYIRNQIKEDELIRRIQKNLIPIRPGRTFARNIRSKCTIPFTYRA